MVWQASLVVIEQGKVGVQVMKCRTAEVSGSRPAAQRLIDHNLA